MRFSPLTLILLLCPMVALLAAADSIAMLQPQQEVNESAGFVDYLVTRSGTGVGAVSVDVQAGAGSAVLGVDYADPVPGTLNWSSGDLAPKIVRLTILHNPAFTYGSYLTISLANPGGGAALSLTAPTNVNLTIADMEANPAGQLTFLADSLNATVTVRDDAGSVPIRVQRSGGTLGAESCTIALIDMTAVAGNDYTVPGSTTVSWNDGEGGVKTLLVPLLSRSQAQGPLSFYAAISMTNGNADPGFGGETITIIDHLPAVAGTLGCPATLVVHELDGSATLMVNRVGGSSGAVSVDYSMSDSLAVAGVNYTAVSGTLNWGNGVSTPQTVSIPILADGAARPPLDAVITFSTPTGGLILPVAPSVSLTILDEDGTAGLLAMSSNLVTVDERDGHAVLTVTRSGGTTGAVSVDYICNAGTAVDGTNYIGTGGTLHWPAGDATTRQISIPIVHDSVPTSELWLNVSLTNPQGGAGLDDGNVDRTYTTIIIQDSDGGAADLIAFAATAVQVHESAGPVLISLVRTGSGIGPASVQLTVQAGTAQPGVDYTCSSDNAVQWADGELGAHTFTIPLVHDGLPGSSRDFSVFLGVAYGNSRAPAPYEAVVTILDDDAAPAGTVTFSPAALSTVSDAGTVQLTLHRSGGSTGAISVDWNTLAEAPSDAQPGVDVVAAAGTVSWLAGDNADKTIAITLLDDNQPGPDHTLVVRLTNAQGGCVINGRDALISIADAGPFPAGKIACLASAQSCNRHTGSATVLVGRSGGSTGAVTVEYRTAAGTAVAGQDFLPTVGSLSWADGDVSNRSITVTLFTPSGVVAGDFSVELSDPTGGAVLGQDNTKLSLPGAAVSSSNSSSGCGSGSGIAALFIMLLASMSLLGGVDGRRRDG